MKVKLRRGVRYVRRTPLDRLLGMETRNSPVTVWSLAGAPINGRVVYVFAKDFTVLAARCPETHAKKITKIQDMALQNRAPIIGLFQCRWRAHSGRRRGARRLSRRVPAQRTWPPAWCATSVIMGPCAGGDVYPLR